MVLNGETMLEARSGHEGVPYAIREDFAVDRDERVVPYDNWLLLNGFKYIHTTMGRYGGSRIYKHPSGITVSVGRWSTDILWSIDRSIDGKPISDGSGIQTLISKLSKLISLTSVKCHSRLSTTKKVFGIIIPRRLDELK